MVQTLRAPSWLCWSSCGVSIPFRAFNPSSYFSIRVPKLRPLFVCGCLHLSESGARWNLSEACHAGLLSTWIQNIINSVRDWYLSMGWVSIWAGYWLVIPSVSASYPVPAFLVDRIKFGLKVLWVGWCPYSSPGVPAWLQEVASSGSISPMLWVTAKVILIDSWAPPLSHVFVSA